MNKEKFRPVKYNHKASMAKELKNDEFKTAYDALNTEFMIFEVMLKARKRAKMTQEEVAEKMHTSRATVARIESCSAVKHSPSINTLKRYAAAVGCKLEINLIPAK